MLLTHVVFAEASDMGTFASSVIIAIVVLQGALLVDVSRAMKLEQHVSKVQYKGAPLKLNLGISANYIIHMFTVNFEVALTLSVVMKKFNTAQPTSPPRCYEAVSSSNSPPSHPPAKDSRKRNLGLLDYEFPTSDTRSTLPPSRDSIRRVPAFAASFEQPTTTQEQQPRAPGKTKILHLNKVLRILQP
jgi:hypothetical protein